ncbi:hypothetical protein GCM10027285_15940 [Oleiagrimonas citrea]|uniref:DUF3301 domain-containing protein n=1 Tax=Oleiagrimonas citrea TaxID=1665687 RepID=A0A846ZI85_9GAMM|nr:DUF3301 domain-containing protein [Oleiagrimonas citrea]NKZ38085.1 DUF3301 domain-containing protein [Oleiagrimonas citrea]
MINEWLFLLGLMAAIGLWLAAMRNRERALHAARGICKTQGVQLLDESVGLSGLRLRRHDGLPQWMLRYAFEVSLDGQDRHTGHLWMAGGRVTGLHTGWPQRTLEEVADPDHAVVDLLQRARRLH